MIRSVIVVDRLALTVTLNIFFLLIELSTLFAFMFLHELSICGIPYQVAYVFVS